MPKEYRSFEGQIKTLRKRGEFLFDVEIWLLNDAVNRNGWKYVNLEQNMAKFAGTPILVAYTKDGKQVGDGHNFELVPDKETGQMVPSFTGADAERIVGALSDDVREIRTEERDGNIWVVGRGSLWRWYSRELVDKIENDAEQGRAMSISIETLVTRSRNEGDVEIEEEYEILGTTILGDHVAPAVAGARIIALEELKEKVNNLKLRAASYQSKPQPNNKGVNRNMNFSKKQLEELGAKFGDNYVVLCARQTEAGIQIGLMGKDGGTAVCTLGAMDDVVTPERIEKMNAQVCFAFGEDESLRVDACDLTGFFASEMDRLSGELKQKCEELDECKNTMTAMRDRECARRLSEAKKIAKETLDQFNANREEKVEPAEMEKLNADIEAGLYTNSVDADGAWIGDQQIRDKVLAACAASVMALDAETAKNAKRNLSWGTHQEPENHNEGVISDLFGND